ncbi:MAG: hypothetical protein GF349_04025 [Candidatus Magasanikbacteria bacterium]|nr:hypothetical protein [Candidatus Magasanikbacteria bacterium]
MENEQINFLEEEKINYNEKNSLKKWRRIFIFSIAFFILVLVFGITRFVATEYAPNDPMAYDAVTLEPKKPEGLLGKIKQLIFHKENTLEGESRDRINILLLGMGGLGHDGPFLTDTIIIASIKPSTNQVAMISIPRDLGVDIPGHGWHKINHANAYGEAENKDWGAAFATAVIEDTFDIDIQYYVRVDFKAFEEVVDEVGGVTVNVERSFVDYMYPAPNDEYQTVSFTEGVKKMDGSEALIYARSRHGSNGEGSDFARAKRQQKVILALKEKVLSYSTLLNPVKINNIMKSLESHITTNMEFADIISFAKMAKDLDTENIINVVLDNSADGYLKNAFSPTGAYILKPKDGNFDEINRLIDNIFQSELQSVDDTPRQDKPDFSYAAIEIQNGTWYAGMAARMRKRLQDNNFSVSSIGNTEQRPQAKSLIYVTSEGEYNDVIKALEEELLVQKVDHLPPGITPASSTDILVILGEDMQE